MGLLDYEHRFTGLALNSGNSEPYPRWFQWNHSLNTLELVSLSHPLRVILSLRV